MVRAGKEGAAAEGGGDIPHSADHGHVWRAEKHTATARPTEERKHHKDGRHYVRGQPGLQRHGENKRQAAGELYAADASHHVAVGTGTLGAVLAGAQRERDGAVGQAAGAHGGAAGRAGGRRRGSGGGGGGGGVAVAAAWRWRWRSVQLPNTVGGLARCWALVHSADVLRLALRRSEGGVRRFAPALVATSKDVPKRWFSTVNKMIWSVHRMLTNIPGAIERLNKYLLPHAAARPKRRAVSHGRHTCATSRGSRARRQGRRAAPLSPQPPRRPPRAPPWTPSCRRGRPRSTRCCWRATSGAEGRVASASRAAVRAQHPVARRARQVYPGAAPHQRAHSLAPAAAAAVFARAFRRHCPRCRAAHRQLRRAGRLSGEVF
ncbi:protease [Gracilaria domingensis]|nr:protease [Gracilaria domingensis]